MTQRKGAWAGSLAVPPQRERPTGPSKKIRPNVYAVTPAGDLVAYVCECGKTHTHRWRSDGCYSALCKDPPPGYRFLLLRQPSLFQETPPCTAPPFV